MLKTSRLTALAGLFAIGTALSTYLTTLHLGHLGTGLPSACNINETLNCDAVNNSAWSKLLGVPVSHLGMLFYLGVLLLALLAGRGGRLAARVHGYLLLLALASGMVSVYLGSVSLLRVRALCLFCMGLYLVNALILAVLAPGGLRALQTLRGTPGDSTSGLLADVRALGQPLAVLLLATFGLAAGASSWVLRTRVLELQAHVAARATVAAPTTGTPPSGSSAPQPAKPEPRIDLDSPTAPTVGPASAKVTIVEVSDFECPFCQRAASTLKEVLAAYPGQLRVVFRHFPLDQACNPLLKRPVHENACAAARAAVCAAARGRFWPLAEKLFAGNTDPDDLRSALRELKLDDAEQRACEQRPATAAVVAADIAAASQAGITAVPVFLINGRPLRGARPLADFRRIIDEELQAAR
jgi:protein-disulfide isomerase/uncharacterized membrane protein